MRFVKAQALCDELDKLERRNEKLYGLKVFPQIVSPYEQHKQARGALRLNT
jgi:hypothetical protein